MNTPASGADAPAEKSLPWWLEGDEQCPCCLNAYSLEIEYHCDHCDGPLCPDCIVEVRVSKWLLCSECAKAAESADTGRDDNSRNEG